MTRPIARGSLLAVGLSALCWTACAAGTGFDEEGPNAGAQAGAGAVEGLAQALGGYTELWRATNTGDVPVNIGSTFTIFKSTLGCNQPVVVMTSSGTPVSFSNSLPVCGDIKAAGSNSDRLVVSVLANRQGRYYVASRPAGQTSYAWTEVATDAVAATKLVVLQGGFFAGDSIMLPGDARPVYQYNFSGTKTKFSPVTGAVLVGAEDTVPPTGFLETVSGSNFVLTSMQQPGVTLKQWTNPSGSFAPGFTFDANDLYWTENAGSVHKVRRVSKTGGTPSDLLSSSTDTLVSPLLNGTTLWWRQVSADGTARIRRKNLANGAVNSAPFPIPSFSQMRLGSSVIYVTGLVAADPIIHYGLIRTPQ